MLNTKLKVRKLLKNEHLKVIDYFYQNTDNDLIRMGVEKEKLLAKDIWTKLLLEEFEKNIEDKKLYYLGWLYENKLVGHSNINNIQFKHQATVHMHIWENKLRGKNLGQLFFKQSLQHYFTSFYLDIIVCEPNAQNSGPNKILQNLGLHPVKTYETIPGSINFLQKVNRYEIKKSDLEL